MNSTNTSDFGCATRPRAFIVSLLKMWARTADPGTCSGPYRWPFSPGWSGREHARFNPGEALGDLLWLGSGRHRSPQTNRFVAVPDQPPRAVLNGASTVVM